MAGGVEWNSPAHGAHHPHMRHKLKLTRLPVVVEQCKTPNFTTPSRDPNTQMSDNNGCYVNRPFRPFFAVQKPVQKTVQTVQNFRNQPASNKHPQKPLTNRTNREIIPKRRQKPPPSHTRNTREKTRKHAMEIHPPSAQHTP